MQEGDSTGAKLGGSIVNALIFVGVITVMTFVIVLLFKYGVRSSWPQHLGHGARNVPAPLQTCSVKLHHGRCQPSMPARVFAAGAAGCQSGHSSLEARALQVSTRHPPVELRPACVTATTRHLNRFG